MAECSREINSEEYIELIYRESVLTRRRIEELEEYCVIPINEKWTLISVPVSAVPENAFEEIGYSAFPGIYGLSDMGAVSAGGIEAVRNQSVLGLYGSGTYIAVIDTGINWRHEAFINADNTTRIKVLWDQESDTVYTEDDINRALAGEDIKIPGDNIGHGTFISGIAAGNTKRSKNFSGVAPLAGLIVVRLRQAKKYIREFYSVRDDVPAYSETDIMRAVAFVIKYTEQGGLIVSLCIGLGTSLGSHSGTSPLCDLLSDEADRTGSCVTVASGNEGIERLHFRGNITDESIPRRVEIRVGEKEKGFTCEMWSNAPEVYTIEIISPTGQIINRVPGRPEYTTRLSFIFEDTDIYIYYRQYENWSGKNLASLRFKNPAPGIWTLNIYGRNLTTGEYDIWIMNREFLTGETYFLEPDPWTTINEPGNTMQCITVSAYDHINNNLYIKNGRGYTASGIIKPDFCAPGVNLTGPSSIGRDTYETRSGTSVAAAFYAGMAALIQEYGIVRNKINFLHTNDIKNITISGCTRQDGIKYPSPLWGYGAVNLYNSLQNMRLE